LRANSGLGGKQAFRGCGNIQASPGNFTDIS